MDCGGLQYGADARGTRRTLSGWVSRETHGGGPIKGDSGFQNEIRIFPKSSSRMVVYLVVINKIYTVHDCVYSSSKRPAVQPSASVTVRTHVHARSVINAHRESG